MPDDESSAHSTLHQDEEEGQVPVLQEHFRVSRNCSWEVAKCKRDAEAIAYCFKDDTHPHGSLRWAKGCKVPKPIEILPEADMVTWQRQLVAYVSTKPDVRRTVWIWSTAGGVGKTRIAKYLAVKHQAMVFNGKGSDVFNGIIQWHEKKGEWPEIMVMNVPLVSKDFVSVTALEAIKDGMFYSGKFERPMPYELASSDRVRKHSSSV